MNYPTQPLAIIGAHCCVPGAFSPGEFWENLSQGKVFLSALPHARYPFDIYKSETGGEWGKSQTNIESIVDLSEFNSRYKPEFIKELLSGGVLPENIPTETGMVLSSYTAYNAIKNAGFDPFNLPRVPFSVYTGIVRLSDGVTHHLVRQSLPLWMQMLQETSPELTPGHIQAIRNDFEERLDKEDEELESYYHKTDKVFAYYVSRNIQSLFKLNGQSFAFDSACSSSLSAFYLAQRFLSLHPEGIALCGGFCLINLISTHLFSQNKACSEKSMPFDQQADGVVQGDGCSYMLVRPLSAALKAGDKILGVIRGVGVSCDGKGKGHWAPSAEGQKRSISNAWQDANVDSSDSPDYIEAHATSTRLGDATELEAVNGFLKENGFEKPIPIASVKANIGHLCEAAGATSVIKVLQSLRHQVILPQTSFHEPTSKFDWDNSPLYVPQALKSWAAVKDKKRLALVEAFGVGGLNAAVVVEGPETAKLPNKETLNAPASVKAIAIVGIGCIAPEAFNSKQFRNRIQQGASVMSFAPDNRGDMCLTRPDVEELKRRGVKAGFINGFQYDWKRHTIPPKQISQGNAQCFWFLDAVDQAIDDAGMPQNIKQSNAHPELWDRSRTAIVTSSKTGTDYMNSMVASSVYYEMERSMSQSLENSGFDAEKIKSIASRFKTAILEKFNNGEDMSGGVTISLYGSKIAKTYDISGPVYSLDGGYSSSVTSLETAFNILQDERIDCALCVSGDRSQGSALRAILRNQDDSIAPPAEGAVAYVLKRADDALENGDKIYAIISKIETSSSNVHISDRHGNTTSIVMRSSASSEVKDIDEPIARVFGDFGPAKGMVALANVLMDIHEQNQTAPASWQIQHKDCEGITVTIDLDNAAAYRDRGKKRAMKNDRQKTDAVPSSLFASGKALRESGNRVAFLFSGQGAFHPNAISAMAELPGASSIIEELDDSLTAVGLPDFKTVLQTEGASLGADPFRTQLSLLAAESFIYRLCVSQGVCADVVMGHSYGELPAMTAAGAWSFQTAALATQVRCRAIESALAEFAANGTRTAMLLTDASEDLIEEGMAAIPEASTSIYISNRNAPTQTILSGAYDSIKRMEAHLRSCQRTALILPAPAAFHSPLMAGVCKSFAEGLKSFTFDIPTKTLLSSVTCAFESDPDVFRKTLAEQIAKPVDFISMIRKAYHVGCRHFVEIGPKNILVNLAKQILSDCSDVTFYSSGDVLGCDTETFPDVCSQNGNYQDNPVLHEKPVIETPLQKTSSLPLQTPSSKPALLDNVCLLTDDAVEAECTINPVNDVFLQQHQLMGRPILPIVMGLELFAETASVLSTKRNSGTLKAFEDVRIVRGVSCTQDVPYRLVCRLEKTDAPNVWNALIKGDFYNKAGKKINENCPYYRCKAVFGCDNPDSITPLASRQSELRQKIDLVYHALGEQTMYHGPTLNCLKTMRYNDGRFAIGDIIPQENEAIVGSRDGKLTLYPAVLDACLYTCGVLLNVSHKGMVIVPDQFKRIEFGPGLAIPGKKCECCSQYIEDVKLPGGYEQKVFNFTLYNDKGEIIANAADFRATVVHS